MHEELVDVWCDFAGIDVSLKAESDGTRRSDGPDGPASLAGEILGGRGLVAPNLIGFAPGQGAIYRDPARRHLSMVATPLGLAEFSAARLRELEAEEGACEVEPGAESEGHPPLSDDALDAQAANLIARHPGRSIAAIAREVGVGRLRLYEWPLSSAMIVHRRGDREASRASRAERLRSET